MLHRPHVESEQAGVLKPDDFTRFETSFVANSRNRMMQNAVANHPVQEVALDRAVATSIEPSFSHMLVDRKVTNQDKTGRCWLFAGLNLLRTDIGAKLGMKDFEISQNFLLFWDKLEKANYFLEAIIATADDEADNRTVSHLLSEPAEDGGQWDMFTALVHKHGIVPKSVMPETESSSNTEPMNILLKQVLRRAARDIRAASIAGRTAHELRNCKDSALFDVHRMLSIHLGTPPSEFFWQWVDDDKKFHRDGMTTPQNFTQDYLSLPLNDYVCLVHDPRPTSEPDHAYTVNLLGNVVGAPPVTYLNTDIDVLRELAMQTIIGGEPVWFGCDTDKMNSDQLGIWDANLYDYDSVYSTRMAMPKPDRLAFHDTSMNHAMLLVGVDVVDGAPRKWRVENSWGENRGDKGMWTMNNNWFDEHVFEIAVRRELLPAKLQKALDTQPTILPAWDPMGSLAGGRS